MKAVLVFLTFVMLVSLGHSAEVSCSFPKNNLRISAHTKSIQGIAKEEFESITKEMLDLYTPIFEKDYGATLVIDADWEDETVNAYAQQSGKTWKVNMFGGLARHVETTKDAYRAVICHEIGHHVGGAPKKGFQWASNEGQADYYATTKCLRKFYVQESQLKETLSIYRKRTAVSDEDAFAKSKCQEVYSELQDKATCYRSALAGKALARLLGSLGGNPEVKFSVPDPKVAAKTDHNHPQAQCRMDTYFQGSLCVNDKDELADPKDVRKGYCTAIDKFTVGLRPACWYKASEYEK